MKGIKQSQQIDLGGEVGHPGGWRMRLRGSSESMGLDSATLLTTAELGLMIRNDMNDHNFH